MRAEDVMADQATLPMGTPSRAGDYEIEKLIGSGAMGEVYAARHPLIGKRAAVKVIKRHLASSPEAVERFLREARAVNQVEHGNVVDVFAVGRLDDGRLYLVMDLLEGEALAVRLRRGRVPLDETLRILDAIAAALDAAHARGVVHRDLKPDNVFLTKDDGVFVLDFGIAKLLAADGAPGPGTLTDRGTWLGTPAYMAPEQWGVDGAGPASDRYALGVIAFELLAGKPPFEASTLPQMMEKHFRADVPSLATGALALPAAVDAVLKRALAKDPDARFASGRELVGALRDALGTSAGPRVVASARRGPARRQGLVVALGGGTAIAALVTGFVLFRGAPQRAGSPPPSPSVRERGPSVEVTSVPPGARVTIGGVDRGVTPVALPLDELRDDAPLVIAKPGYAAVTRRIDREHPAPVRVSLTPVTRFEGVWALPDGALRAFERRGEQVAMFVLDDAAGERRFERFFEFVGADAGLVAFTAAEDHVDPRAPDEPSCHTRLAAEYTYDLEHDTLTRKQERAQVDFDHGHCALRARSWGDAIALRRLAAEDGGDWVESTAGAGQPSNVDAKDPKIDEPLVPQVPVPQEELKKKAPPKKRPQKVAPPPKEPVQQKPVPQQQANEPDLQNQQVLPPTKK